MAVRVADGESAWSASLGAPARLVAAVGRDSAAYFALADGSLAAVSLSAGKFLWTVTGLGSLSPAIAAGDRVVVGLTENSDKMLYAFNARSGAEAWRLSAGDVVGAASADTLVFFVSKDNVAKAVSRDSGNQRWLKTMTTRPIMPPLYSTTSCWWWVSVLFLALFDARTGMPSGTYTFSGDLQGAILDGEPILAASGPDGSGLRLILVTRDGRVVALRPGTEKTQSDSGSEHGDKAAEPDRKPVNLTLRSTAEGWREDGSEPPDPFLDPFGWRRGNDSRILSWPLPSTKKALPITNTRPCASARRAVRGPCSRAAASPRRRSRPSATATSARSPSAARGSPLHDVAFAAIRRRSCGAMPVTTPRFTAS